jgi:NAD(P)H dehydrogenase (quinone)
MILITGATGKLGHFIVNGLMERGVPASELAVLARTPDRASDFAKLGAQVRPGDYSDPRSLDAAVQGVGKPMFISSSEIEARAFQHHNVVAAAKKAGVPSVIYTSILNADDSPLDLARDHRDTEKALRESGLSYTLLRNGWYFENYTENLATALEHGALLGAAGEGVFSMAARKDYADAAVSVLVSNEEQGGRVYELGGAPVVTLSDLSREVARQANRPVAYVNLSTQEYESKLIEFGLPAPVARLLSNSDEGAKNGFLQTESHDLQKLIGRPSTTLEQAVELALFKG